MKHPRSEQGMTLLILVVILVLATTGYLLKSLDSAGLRNERDKRTSEALAEAKAALLGFATSQNLTPGVCTTNCPRPGDLPCPDTDNNGIAEVLCGNAAGTTQQVARLGRLPWITLGLPDLRDGDGERLWYAVSSNYKNNTRFRPLNSNTLATITLRDNNGNFIFNGTNNGLAALVIAPGAAIVRQDNISQTRNGANQLIASNYLDVALGEDNQNFVDSNINGFISGPVKDVNGKTVVNDRMLGITRNEMNQVMETRVLAEVKNSLTAYFLGAGALSYPRPANFNVATCLGSANINAPNCPEGALTHGRIPANPGVPWSGTSILRGIRNGNWFQLNAWREVIHYAVAPACATGTANCDGIGFLTLNNSQVLPTNAKQLVLIAAGAGIGVQTRVANANKTAEVNYLEGDNLLPLDDIYTRTIPLTSINNDRIVSLP
jgi:type II secretory pathway pseudopilin PulG